MSTITDVLQPIADGLAIIGVPPTTEAGVPLSLGLSPQLGPVSFTEILNVPISLDLLAKEVEFPNTPPVNPNAANFLDPTPAASVFSLFDFTRVPPATDATTFPGFLGRLTGQFPVPMLKTLVPVFTEIHWQITTDGKTPAVLDEDYIAPLGLDTLAPILAFLPTFVRYTGRGVDLIQRYVSVSGKVTMAGESVDFAVEPIPISLPAIPIPELIVFSRDKNYHGAKLIFIRSKTAPPALDNLKTILQPVTSVLQNLKSVVRFANILLGIEAVETALSQTDINYGRGKRTEDLTNFDISSGFFNDTEWDQEVSSFLLIGPPNSSAAMYNSSEYDSGLGRFEVTTGDGILAMCSDSHHAKPVVFPESASLTVTHPAMIYVFSGHGQFSTVPGTFGDSLTSLEFIDQ